MREIKLMAKRRGAVRWIVVVIVYWFYLLLFFEAASRTFLSVGPIFWRIKGWDDSSQRIEWMKRHSDQQEFVYKFDVYHPMRGWTLEPNIKDMIVFNGKILNSNNRGIRGKTAYEYRRQSGKQRIIVMGDSYTFGDEVSDDETYSQYLGSLLPDVEVLNLGIHGYGHDQMLLYLKEEGVKYNPDVVILGFVWFDIFRNLFEFNNYSKPKFELRDHELHLTNVPVPHPSSFLDQELYRSKALDLGIILFEKLKWKLGLNRKRAKELSKAIFDEMVTTIRQIGAVPVFVYLPVLDEISNPNGVMTLNEQFLFTYCEEREIPCLFLRQRFLEEKKKGVEFNIQSHWFVNEHMTAARGIKEYLLKNGLIERN